MNQQLLLGLILMTLILTDCSGDGPVPEDAVHQIKEGVVTFEETVIGSKNKTCEYYFKNFGEEASLICELVSSQKITYNFKKGPNSYWCDSDKKCVEKNINQGKIIQELSPGAKKVRTTKFLGLKTDVWYDDKNYTFWVYKGIVLKMVRETGSGNKVIWEATSFKKGLEDPAKAEMTSDFVMK